MAEDIKQCTMNVRKCKNGMILTHTSKMGVNEFVAKNADEMGVVIGQCFAASLNSSVYEDVDEFNFRVTLKTKILPF